MIEGFRLSPQQRHLWALQQDDHTAFYRARCAVLIEGPLDLEIFEAAVQNIFARHEIFRTTISCLPGTTIPLQVIAESSTPSINIHDLCGSGPHGQEAGLESLFQAAGESPFNCGKNLPANISLATLSADKHMLIVAVSALCADMVTLTMFVRELSLFYAASRRGETLAAAALQYVDIAQWENELLEAADTRAGREYWRKQNLSCGIL